MSWSPVRSARKTFKFHLKASLVTMFSAEWRHGSSGHLVLPSQDYRADPNSRWRRLMTISDYKISDNATLALIPKQNEYEESEVIFYKSIFFKS